MSAVQLPLAEFDPAVLDHLLRLAGPIAGAELLMRLETDLKAVQAGIVTTLGKLNWPELQRESHVLISIAGTIGATALHLAADRLNSMAQKAAPAAPQFCPQVITLLERVLMYLAQLRRDFAP